jgi:hypothetical protein
VRGNNNLETNAKRPCQGTASEALNQVREDNGPEDNAVTYETTHAFKKQKSEPFSRHCSLKMRALFESKINELRTLYLRT